MADTAAMYLRTRAIVLAVRHHGEHGGVVRALTRDDGLQPGYVRGARGRALRPVLQPGNVVLAEWRARTDDQLPALTVELVHSYAPLHAEPLPAAAIDWIAAATAAALPEGQPYPMLHDALAACLDAIEAAPAARGWAVALVRYELLLLAQLGFGLDLSTCVVTGAADAAFVSPRTGGAVSVAGAGGYAARLLPIPGFLRGEVAEPGWPALLDGLALTGHFLSRHIFVDRRIDPMAARHRLVERLKRAVA